MQEVEPILNPEVTCLALTKGHGHILDPGGYMQALAGVLQAEGGHYRQAEARERRLEELRGPVVQSCWRNGSAQPHGRFVEQRRGFEYHG